MTTSVARTKLSMLQLQLNQDQQQADLIATLLESEAGQAMTDEAWVVLGRMLCDRPHTPAEMQRIQQILAQQAMAQ